MNNLLTQNDIKKHYAWLINSPQLLKKGMLPNMGYQTFFYDLVSQNLNFSAIEQRFNKRAQNNNKQRYHLPLGKYVETIFEYHFKQDPNLQLIQQNTQVQGNNETIGEIDYLLEINNQVTHVELAIKFYLCHKNPNNPNHWIGPNAKDNLANKLVKNEHAFSLTQTDAYKMLWKKVPTQWQWLIKGCWFFHPNQPNVFLNDANTNSEIGIWLHAKEISLHLKNHEYYLPNKLEWISPNQVIKNTLNKKQLIEFVDTHFLSSKRAVMVWNLTTLTRICIVTNDWPNL